MTTFSPIPDRAHRAAALLALGWLGLASPASSQQPDPEILEEVEEGVVRHFMVSTPSDVDLVATREQLEVELRAWGLDVSNCDYLRQLDEELDAEIVDRYPLWRFDDDLVQDKKMLAAKCLPPPGEAVYYIVKVSLDVDPEFGNQKRASVQLLPIGESAAGRREFYGGYAHRPFAERASWSEVIARAIQRAIGGLDEPPSLHIVGETRGKVGEALLFDAGESWDPDGDPFRIEWTATVPACIKEVDGSERVYPKVTKSCPKGMEAEDHPVQMLAGETSRDRMLSPAIVGVHTVTATPVAGPKVVGDAVTRAVSIRPRNPDFIGLSLANVPLPGGVFADAAPASGIGLASAVIYKRRIGHGVTLGTVGESLVGLHAGALTDNIGDATSGGWFVGVNTGSRVTNTVGMFGVETGFMGSVGRASTERGGVQGNGTFLMANLHSGPYLSTRRPFVADIDNACVPICMNMHLGVDFGLVHLIDDGTGRARTIGNLGGIFQVTMNP